MQPDRTGHCHCQVISIAHGYLHHQNTLLRPHRNTSRAAGHTAVAERDEDPVGCRIKGDIAVALHEDPKGRRLISIDLSDTMGPMAETHWPVAGFVSQRLIITGKAAFPVSAEAVIVPVAPTFTVATANTPVPVAPGMSTMPPLAAAKATMSGVVLNDDESSRVLIPVSAAAGARVFSAANVNITSVGTKAVVGVRAIR